MLISLIIALVVAILLLYLVQLAPLDDRLTFALQVLIIVAALIYVLGFR